MMTNEIFIALISVLVTAFVTLTSVYLTNRNNYNTLKIRLLSETSFKKYETHLKKLEELFLQVQNWETVLGDYYLRHSSAIKGEVSSREAWNSIIEKGKEYDFEIRKIEMLVYVYFQELKEDYEKIVEKTKGVSYVINKFEKINYSAKVSDNDLFKEFGAANLLLFTQMKEFKEEILLFSKKCSYKIESVV